MNDQKYALAESSFRISLSIQTNAFVLNDLAWLLQKRNANDEALELIHAALALDDKNGNTWDTLAAVLMNQEKLVDAENAYQKALSLLPNNPLIQFNMAKLYEKKGQIDAALELADKLLGRPTEMSPQLYDEIQDMVSRHRAKKS